MKSAHNYDECVKKNNWRVINCRTCGYWHVYPMPEEKELAEYYRNKYYKTLKGNRSMTDKFNDPDGFYSLQYADRLRQIHRFLPTGMPKTVIDIGAGYGDFLSFMKKNNWKVQGSEPSELAFRKIKDNALNIKLCSMNEFEEAGFKPAAVVALNNVLEHLRQPQKVLDEVRKHLLLRGGIVSIVMPNDFNILQDLIMKSVLKNNPDKRYYWVAPPDHLNYWSTCNIGRFLDRCGFKAVFMTCDFPMELFPLMGEDYVSYPEVGRSAHLKRVRFEKYLHQTGSFKFKDSIFESFAKLGIGRDMQVIAVPKRL